MASAPEQKPKRTPIVLNMHMLYKDSKDSKDVKDAKPVIKDEPDKGGKDKSKMDDTKAVAAAAVSSKESKDEKDMDKGKMEVDKQNGVQKDDQSAGKNMNVNDQNDRICRDFKRNMCLRGDRCKFYHPPQAQTNTNPSAPSRRRNSWLVLCHDFQNGQCARSDCRYFHITREDEKSYHSTGDIHPLVVDQVMRKAYHFDIFRSGTRPPCREFLRGTCDMATCKYRHLNRREYEDEVFRTLQEEFELVFGPPETRGNSPSQEAYPQRTYQDPAWGYEHQPRDPNYDLPHDQGYDSRPNEAVYDPQPRDFRDTLGPDDLRTSILGHGEFEPDAKRRRHYSNEMYYGPRGGFDDDRRRWNERTDYARGFPVDTAENERMMRELTSLRNENMEMRRTFEQQVLTLKDQVNILTEESASLRHENSLIRTSMNEADAAKKNAVDKLMIANDTLTADNKQLKNSVLKVENETMELKKMNERKFEAAEREKEELKRSLAKAKESEQKMREEIEKLRKEKATLTNDRNNAKTDMQSNSKVAETPTRNDRSEASRPQAQNQDRGPPGRLGAGSEASHPQAQNQDRGPPGRLGAGSEASRPQAQNQDRGPSGRMGAGFRGAGAQADYQRQNDNPVKSQDVYGDGRGSNMRGFGYGNDNTGNGQNRMDWTKTSNSWNNQSNRSDWSKAWGSQQQSNDRQSGDNWSNKAVPNPQQNQWSSGNDKAEAAKAQSLLGEYVKPHSSLLGEYAPGRGVGDVRTDLAHQKDQSAPRASAPRADFKDNQPQTAGNNRGPNDDHMNNQYMGSRYRFEDRDYGLRDNRDYGLRGGRDYGLSGYDKDLTDMRSSYGRGSMGSDSRSAAQSSQWGRSNLPPRSNLPSRSNFTF